jgi:hypothetical protein
MRRILLVLAVAALMAAMLVANSLPAFAAANETKSSCRGDGISDEATTQEGGHIGDGTSLGARFQFDNYGQDLITTDAHGTDPLCLTL